MLFYQPTLHGTTDQDNFNKKTLVLTKLKLKTPSFFSGSYVNLEVNFYHQLTYALFIASCLYAASFLPYGRFYNRLGGNIGMLLSYLYLFMYLGFTALRRPTILESYVAAVFAKTSYLRTSNLDNKTK